MNNVISYSENDDYVIKNSDFEIFKNRIYGIYGQSDLEKAL